jgi:hypothetical protein
MFSIKSFVAYATVGSLLAGGFIVSGAPAALATTAPPQPHEEPSEGISVPVFGLIAIGGIAAVAIWQGINDAKKKKQTQLEEEREIKEVEEFEEYFDFGPEDADAAETANPESAATETTTGTTAGK